MATAAQKFKFSEGEKVLCFHGPLLYEAKCIKSQVKDKQVKYFIHYSGWNKNWDEWVPESRVLKYNDSNRQKQKELEKVHLKPKKAKAGKHVTKTDATEKERAPSSSQDKPKSKPTATPSTSGAESAADSQKKKKTRTEQNVKPKEESTQKIEIKITIPEELKAWLMDDWDLITRQRKLLHLPARITVEHILGEFVRYKLAERGKTCNKEAAIKEVTSGIRDYFNVMLGKQLLYKFERPQYQDLLSEYPGKPMSEIYGGMHLLRLLAKMGTILAYTPLDDESIQLLMNHFQEFLNFMSLPYHSFLSLSDYEIASPEYHRKAV